MRYFRLYEDLPNRTPLGYGPGAGRWHASGIPMIYCCSVSALNFLEFLAIRGPIVAQAPWILAEYEISDDIPLLDAEYLPSAWNRRPYHQSTQNFGSNWVRQQITPFLKVPSCRIPLSRYPEEHNLLINPVHPETARLLEVKRAERVWYEVDSTR